MKAICTYCSRPKRTDSRELPAVRRYMSPRIDQLHEAAQTEGAVFLILSGKYGLLTAEQPIAWYDHLLAETEVESMVPAFAGDLTRLGITNLDYYSADPARIAQLQPYLKVVQQACQSAGVNFQMIILPGNPD